MLKLEAVCKTYRTTEVETRALDNVSLEIGAGEFVAVMGPSGCGKSTMLNLLGLLDNPTSGALWFFGEDVARYSEDRLTALRRTAIGFVFQSFNLIDDLSVAENVEVALIYRGVSAKERRRRVRRGAGTGGPVPSRQAPAAATVRRSAATRRRRPRPWCRNRS